MMPPAPVELALPQSSSPSKGSSPISRFSGLRGVRWRIDLGIFPGSFASVDDLRRVAADCRRRYASLRRRLIIDPHVLKDESKSSILVVDNPLSQSPDSMWGRFFQNAELERILDQDLTRLYPEDGSYFQTATCQSMLRRILLSWCLMHPEYGYRQGMHELLAPLLYVLHVDIEHLLQVRGQYLDHFNDNFHGTSIPETDSVSNHRFKRVTSRNIGSDQSTSLHEKTAEISSLDELDPDTRDIFVISDAYGAEGELGVIVSEKFIEHDAYCMFDVLMIGSQGVVSMAEFFSPTPSVQSMTGVPSIIEASSAVYELLSRVDCSLHSHLLELGVEPQYFALRWLRVLFGREFLLQDLLIIWDEIFSCLNNLAFAGKASDLELNCRILCSPRGAFISALAVSMLLHLRSSLLATEHATLCLQRLLNFPEDVNVKILMEKAKSLQSLAFDTFLSMPPMQGTPKSRSSVRKGHSLSLESGSTSPNPLSDSYWEEKWRSLHEGRESKKGKDGNPSTKKGSLRERLGLHRRGHNSSSANSKIKKNSESFNNIQETAVEEDQASLAYRTQSTPISKESICVGIDMVKDSPTESADQTIMSKSLDFAEETCLSSDNSFSTDTGPLRMINDNEYDSEEGSVTSSLYIYDDGEESNHDHKICSKYNDKEAIQPVNIKTTAETSGKERQGASLKEPKLLSGKFQWLRKFGKGTVGVSSEKDKTMEQQRPSLVEDAPTSGATCSSCGVDAKTIIQDENAISALRNIGISIHENVEVIESILKQIQAQGSSVSNLPNSISEGKQQDAALIALMELRKISNLLSEA